MNTSHARRRFVRWLARHTPVGWAPAGWPVRWIACIAAVASLAGPGTAGLQADEGTELPPVVSVAERNRDAAAVRAVQVAIVPIVARFRVDTRRVERAVVRYCTSPSAVSWTFLSEAFLSTVSSYGAVSVLKFGPAVETLEIDRLGTAVVGTSFVQAEIGALIAGTGLVAEPTTLQELSASAFAFQGLPALEVILGLHRGQSSQPAPPDARHCRLARLIAANVAAISADLHLDWRANEGFPATFVSPGPDNPRYLSRRALARDVVEIALSAMRDLQSELAPFAGGREVAIDARTFAGDHHQAAYLGGKVFGIWAFLSPDAFGSVIEDPGGGAVPKAADLLERAAILLANVEAHGGLADTERPTLTAAAEHIQQVQAALAATIAPATEVDVR